MTLFSPAAGLGAALLLEVLEGDRDWGAGE